jgi:hypothetical protein
VWSWAIVALDRAESFSEVCAVFGLNTTPIPTSEGVAVMKRYQAPSTPALKVALVFAVAAFTSSVLLAQSALEQQHRMLAGTAVDEPRPVSEIPVDFQGSWHFGEVSQCQINTLDVSQHEVFDGFGAYAIREGRLSEGRLSYESTRCEEGECAATREIVSLELRDGRLFYSHYTDESGEPIGLARCP